MIRHAMRTCGIAALALLAALAPLDDTTAQTAAAATRTTDSVTVAAGPHYRVGVFHRWLLGANYRDLWTTPIRVPVLDLSAIGGGLVPEKLGGGKSTLSLHLDAANGAEYVFRTVDKDPRELPGDLGDVKLAAYVARDLTTGKHPAANLLFEPFFDAVGVLHDDDPQLYVMPDDPALGEHREQLAGRLGVLSLFPSKNPTSAAKFGAIAIVDTDSLLRHLSSHPEEQVDPTRYLRARLVDMLLNDWDRHPGNWKWAQLAPGGDWQPIARDMDNVLASQEGALPRLAKAAVPKVVTFDSTYPSMGRLTFNSFDLDRRFLSGTSRAGFDSVATWVRDRITDSVIAAGMARMPVEYAGSQAEIAAKLRFRRDSIPAVADQFYLRLSAVVDIHTSDAVERAVVDLVDSQSVVVRVQRSDGTIRFARRFVAGETREIRLYLHGGDDRAVVRGEVPASIPLRIIGGNGDNDLVDSSRVAGRSRTVRLYDRGPTEGVEYGVDTLADRRPLVAAAGGLVKPGRDWGTGGGPVVGLSTHRDMGVMPKLGWVWRRYGFRQQPYAIEVAVAGRYSFRNDAFAVQATADKRRPESRLHFTALARMSQLELLNFHGLGNSTPSTPGIPVGTRAPRDGFYAVHQDEWLLHPAVAWALGPEADLRVGPVVQYTVSNGPEGGFLETTAPYGAGHFGQAGLRASLQHDTRDRSSHPRSGLLAEAGTDWFPAIWDARGSFGSVGASVGGYLTLPLPLRPYVGLHVAGRKVFGDFPFHEAAFIGGRGGIRTLDPQRYAGDASLAGKLDLRIPLFEVYFALPLEIGAFAAQEVARVYLDGASPDGWHNTFGAGFWVGFQNISVSIRLIENNEVGRGTSPVLQIGHSVGIP